MKFIFFPGLGADSRLSEFHRIEDSPLYSSCGGGCMWVEWPELDAMHDLDSLTEHVLNLMSFGGDCLLVGISFGGLVAQSVARRIAQDEGKIDGGKERKVRGVVLISSFLEVSEIAVLPRTFGVALPVAPSALFNVDLAPDFLFTHYFGIHESAHLELFRVMNADMGPLRTKRLCQIMLGQKGPIPLDCPVLRVHGSRDKLIPFRECVVAGDIIQALSARMDEGSPVAGDECRNAKGCDGVVLIEGGGHLLSFTHQDDVNGAILGFAARLECGRVQV